MEGEVRPDSRPPEELRPPELLDSPSGPPPAPQDGSWLVRPLLAGLLAWLLLLGLGLLLAQLGLLP